MKLRMVGITLAIFSAVMLWLPLIVSAQSFGLDTAAAPFTVTLSPQYPSPYGSSVITPISGIVDLNNSIMTVMVNKKQVYKGNAQPVSVRLGASGTLTSVKVSVLSDGKTYDQTLSIRPQDVVIIAEPTSSAPVLYAGKSLIPIDGNVRIVAVANVSSTADKPIDSSKLSYTWRVSDTEISNSSGIGKNAIIVAAPLQYRSRDVSVTVQSQDGTVGGGATLSLAPEEPTVRIYENDPLLGILFDHTVANSITINDTEKSLYAAPYSFSTANGAPLLKWFLNGSAAQTGNSITLRPTGAGKGSASLSLVATSGDTITATTNLSLSFGSAPAGGLFGL